MNKEITGYLIISTTFEPIKLGLTEDCGEYFAIGGWENIDTALKYKVIADETNPYYFEATREYIIPCETDIAVKVIGQSSDYLIKKKEVADFIQSIQLLQRDKKDEPNTED